MYNPASFRESRLEVMHDLMRRHPFATLVSAGAGGLLAAPLPFVLYPEEGAFGVLRAHFARANPHWREFVAGGEALVIFQGEHGYVTPDWYPSKAETHRAVPTWNYAMVQARGAVTLHEDADWLCRMLDDLTRVHEGIRPTPWQLAEAPADYVTAQMKAIVGIEIVIGEIDGKWKMSQNRALADRQGVAQGLADADDPHANSRLAAMVAERLD